MKKIFTFLLSLALALAAPAQSLRSVGFVGALAPASTPEVEILATTTYDGANSGTPGTSISFSASIPSGTNAVVIAVLENNGATSSYLTSGTLGGVALSVVATAGSPAATGNIFGHVLALTSSISTGTQTVALSGRTNTGRALFVVVWALKNASTNTGAWVVPTLANVNTTATSRGASISPTAASGMVLGLVGWKAPGTTGTITVAGFTEDGVDYTPDSSSTAISSLACKWGTQANTTTSARNVGGAVATASQGAAVALWIPKL